MYKLIPNFSLKENNSFGLDVRSDYWLTLTAPEDWSKALTNYPHLLQEEKLIIGGGTNLLFLSDFDGLIISPDISGFTVTYQDNEVVEIEVGAGVEWDDFVAYCVGQGWYGVENLSLVPGKVGAAPVQNIGAYGVEAGSVILQVKEYALSFYNLGYQYFNKQDFMMAASFFTKYTELADGESGNLLGDVYNRLGDCKYADRNFEAALDYYQKAIDYNSADADYSLFQMAFTHGLMQDQQTKIAELEKLSAKYPESPYCDDALFETGKAMEKMSDFGNAESNYKSLIDKYPGSPLIPKALVQLGLIAYNQHQYDTAIAYYKEVISRYPDTPEARGALTGIKNNYLENNRVEDYIAYTKKLGRGTTPSQNEQDSLSYFEAEKLYMSHAPNAAEQLSSYLTSFPQGNFTVNARFYRAECAYNTGDTAAALQDYEAVLAEPDNLFTGDALTKAAELSYDAKAYSKALGYFQRMETIAGTAANVLEGTIGTLRCHYEMGHWDEVTKIGWKLRSNGKISPELDREVSYKSAKAYEALNDQTKALPLWRKLSADPKSQEGAEAKYNVCKYYADNNRLKDAENEVMDFISKNSPQKYWLGKSFVLLAHVYEKMNDLFQATNTLKSVIENYEVKDDGIVDEASAYLKILEQKK